MPGVDPRNRPWHQACFGVWENQDWSFQGLERRVKGQRSAQHQIRWCFIRRSLQGSS